MAAPVRAFACGAARPDERGTGVRRVAAVGIGALLAGSCIIALLHLIGPGADISPIRKTISEYALTSVAWAFDIAVLMVAGGSAAVLLAAWRARDSRPDAPRGRIGPALGALWVLGLVTLVAFPKANWALGPSLSGQIHRAASLVAFLALPVAVFAVLRAQTSRGAAGHGLARTGAGLALAAPAWLVPIVLAIATAHGGAWWLAVPLGLLERGMAVTEIAALVVLGRWAARTIGSTASCESVPPAAAPAGPAAAVTDPAVP